MTDAKDLISKLKRKKIILLNAAEWNVVFKAYQEDEDLREDAREIIYKYVDYLIKKTIIKKNINGIFADSYRTDAQERVERKVLANPNWVVVSHLRTIVEYWSLADVMKSPESQLIKRSVSTSKNKDGETQYIVYTLPDDKPKIENKYICKEQEQYVLKCVDEMNEKDRFVVKSRYFKRITQKEIAKVLKVERSAVAERLRRIKRFLRTKIAEIDAEKTVSYATSEGV